ncbi:MAG: PAS domain S-box protein [Povalibacter sp.]
MESLTAALGEVLDAVLVTDSSGVITYSNESFRNLWRLEAAAADCHGLGDLLSLIAAQVSEPETFVATAQAISADPRRESFDLIALSDARLIERSSRVHHGKSGQWLRTWVFRDVTERVRARSMSAEHAHTLQLLGRISRTIASQSRIDQVVQIVTDAAIEVLGAQFGAFVYNSINEQGDHFTLQALSAESRSVSDPITPTLSALLLSRMSRSPRILRSDDLLNDPECGFWSEHFAMPPGHSPVRSFLAVPVFARSGEIQGGLFFAHSTAAVFTGYHESLAQSIAVQAGVAVESSRWFEAAERAQRELQNWNETLEQRVQQRTSELRRSELQFRQLVAGVADYAIYMLDPNGYVSSWNPGAERIKGYTAQEIIGQHFSLFYTDEDRAEGRPQRALEIAAREGKYEAEAWRVRKDGTRFWANVLVDVIRDDEGNTIGFAKVTRDMTERRAMQEQLHQSQKMEAIGQLTGGVAHDFNNLLTVILGNLDTIARRLPEENERLQRSVRQAMQGAERAATLTGQLLAFARRQPLNPKPTDVSQLVLGMSDLIHRTLREDIVIENVLSEGIWMVEVDPHQLESALLNLAVNARDAMPAGGRLIIETSNTFVHGHPGSADMLSGEYVVIAVADTGTGMTSDVMSRAFDPFFTTKPIGEGTGLGLSQVFGFVKQSGGHVRLRSQVGQGTTVSIYLPRLAGVDQITDVPAPISTPKGYSDEVILVVEDDDDVRIYTTESLRELGFAVLEAHNGTSALRILEHHPEIAMVFTDVGLPGMNGRELIDEARLRRPDLRILFTTGYERSALMHDGRLDPGVELLTKPFTRAQLASRVRAVLDRPLEAS